MSRESIGFAVLAVALNIGCAKSQAADRKEQPVQALQVPTAPPLPPVAAPEVPSVPVKPAQHVEIEIASVGNTMAYDKTKLSVPAGAEVHLTLKNNATVSTLSHNWVLVKAGTEASVAAAGLKWGEKAGYIDARDHDMFAFSPLAKPGETVDFTFTAPDEPGKYPYICTMPGHYMMMNGVLTVTP